MMPADPTVPVPGPGTLTWTVDDDGIIRWDQERYLNPVTFERDTGSYAALVADVRAARAHERCGPAAEADYLAALDVIARLTTGWDANGRDLGPLWHRPPFFVEDEATEATEEPMSDREWRVFCEAAQRATRTTT